MNERIDVNLIHLPLLQHEQKLVKIQIALIVYGEGTEGGLKRHWVRPDEKQPAAR
jgi:hypothetical protein